MRKMLKGDVAHSKDVKVGQVLSVTITDVRDFGLVVDLGNGVSAVCPSFHTADMVFDGNLKKKFKAGQVLKIRVWEVEGSKIIVTNKKTMVNLAEGAVITSYDDLHRGAIVHGVVASVDEYGLTVRFFNKIRGMISTRVLAKQGVLNPEQAYRNGQVIKTVVVHKAKNPKHTRRAKASPLLNLALDHASSTEEVLDLVKDEYPDSQVINSDDEDEGS
jgi:ribosomal protein S1